MGVVTVSASPLCGPTTGECENKFSKARMSCVLKAGFFICSGVEFVHQISFNSSFWESVNLLFYCNSVRPC